MKRILTGFLVAASVCGGAVSSFAGTVRCVHCGVTSDDSAKVVVERTDGKSAVYESPKCAFFTEDPKKIRKATATDFFSRKTIDARKAFYVADTTVGVGDPPYWVAFESEEIARKFIKGFDGDLETFEEAFDELRSGEHAGHDAEWERYHRPHHDDAHEHDWDR